MNEPILDRPLTHHEIEACFYCRRTRSEGDPPFYFHSDLAKLGLRVSTCPEHMTLIAGTSGRILLAFYRLLQPQLETEEERARRHAIAGNLGLKDTTKGGG